LTAPFPLSGVIGSAALIVKAADFLPPEVESRPSADGLQNNSALQGRKFLFF